MNEVLQAIESLRTEISITQRDVFTTKEAAAYLRISKDMLLQQVRLGHIAYTPNGRNFLFQRKDLMDWMENNRRYSNPEEV